MTSTTTSITVDAELSQLSRISGFVVPFARHRGLGPSQSYRLQLAVDELATNIVLHGYQEAGMHGSITVEHGADDEELWVTLDDQAPAFDPTAYPMPDDLDSPLHEREVGGLGLYLSRIMVDRLTYSRVAGHNRSTLVVRRDSGTVAAVVEGGIRAQHRAHRG
jgi:anti-sigma regulatory factor (Ser/Thr protein kinase)